MYLTAATMFASAGASTKEIMNRGGWKSVTMVVRYEHASDRRDAQLADALNPALRNLAGWAACLWSAG